MPDTLPTGTTPGLGRRALLGGAAAVAASAALAACSSSPGTDPSPVPPTSGTGAPGPQEGLGSVARAPNLPPGFTDTFTDRFVDAGGLRHPGRPPGRVHPHAAAERPARRPAAVMSRMSDVQRRATHYGPSDG